VKTIVLGAGVIGVSAAYYLSRAGHEVVVVDRQAEPAMETSFANGGQVSASHAWPWSNPKTLWDLLSWVGRKDAPLAFTPNLDPAFWSFLIQFLANCRSKRSAANAAAALSLALYNRQLLADLREETNISFDAEDKGVLHLYRNAKDLDRASKTALVFRDMGLNIEAIDGQACAKIEPALAHQSKKLAGGIYSPDDLSGDAHAFTTGLAQIAADNGVEFQMNTNIIRLSAIGDAITGVMTDRGMITGNRYVLALGSYSPLLLKPLGIKIPVYPTKGYSATIPLSKPDCAPRVSITDDDNKIVISRFQDQLRIAGTAEFNRYNTDINMPRAEAVLDAGMKLFPRAFKKKDAEFWAGLRPLTPDGIPVIGKTRFTNLFLNTGHGTLGWTLACASAKIIADIATNRETDIDISAFRENRF